MFDIVSLGELLIDFTESGVSPAGQRLFEQNAGGAVAIAASAAWLPLASRTVQPSADRRCDSSRSAPSSRCTTSASARR